MDTSSDGRRAAASDGGRTFRWIRIPSLGLRGLLIATALSILAVVGVEQFELTPSYPMTRTLMQTQDLPVLVPTCALLLILAALPLRAILARWAKDLAATLPFSLAVPILFAAV